jgi:alpha-beta hydrolase superfamily lysophospholipase
MAPMSTDTEVGAGQHQDVLGPDYTAQILEMRPDFQGPVIATLVRRLPAQRSNRAVLFLHGFVDYFFHDHVAREFTDHGFDFYALDLRKYGRSILPHQTPCYAADFTEYDEELDAAIEIIRAEGHDEVVLYGHSNGGLILPLWANRRRGQGLFQAMVLNSPNFDLNGSRFKRGPFTRIVERVGPFLPMAMVSNLPSPYAQALHISNGGEWDFNTTWKPIGKFPVRAGWARAMRRAHAELNAGLDVDVPILVAASVRSGNGHRSGPHHKDSDCVLNVEHMVAGAGVVGRDVTLIRIEGGLHDLTLSPTPVRRVFFDAMFGWLSQKVPA